MTRMATIFHLANRSVYSPLQQRLLQRRVNRNNSPKLRPERLNTLMISISYAHGRRLSWIPAAMLASFVIHLRGFEACKAQAVNSPASPQITTKQSKRPPMPVFDEETVKSKLLTIDAPYSMALLKVGYFSRRPAPYPAAQGFQELKAAIAKEPVGSHRWILLESLAGHAAFRIAGVDADEGFAAYSLLFRAAVAQPSIGSDPKSVAAVNNAVTDFLLNVRGRVRELGLLQSDNTVKTFLLAWEASNAMQRRKAKFRAPEPQWGETVLKARLQSKLLPVMDKVMDDPHTVHSYAALKLAAIVYAPTQPEKAISVLHTAKQMIPVGDRGEVQWLYKSLEDLIAPAESQNSAKLQEAVLLQREMLRLYDYGRPQLINLLLRARDDEGIKSVLRELKKPDAGDWEIVGAAGVLARHAQNNVALRELCSGRASDLLYSYVEGDRPRDEAAEKQARLMLAKVSR